MVKVFGIAVAAHALLAFALFSLIFLLPDAAGPLAAAAGGAFDDLAQPFVGPHRLLALPATAERVGLGVPWFLLSSATWAAAATLAVAGLRRRRAAAYRSAAADKRDGHHGSLPSVRTMRTLPVSRRCPQLAAELRR